jgi:hypothetical protein
MEEVRAEDCMVYITVMRGARIVCCLTKESCTRIKDVRGREIAPKTLLTGQW